MDLTLSTGDPRIDGEAFDRTQEGVQRIMLQRNPPQWTNGLVWCEEGCRYRPYGDRCDLCHNLCTNSVKGWKA